MKLNKESYKKALTLSVFLMMLWAILGTGTTIAWFTDVTPVKQNTFVIGEMDLKVSYKNELGIYEEIKEDTKVFDEEALYEPGYVQVVRMKVENQGNVPFEYKFSVDVNDVTVGTSVLGNDIYLPNYLLYGVIFGDSEAELDRVLAETLATREFGENTGNYPLNTYSEKDTVVMQANDVRYVTLIVRMPDEVGNQANARGNVVPTVILGLNVTASQEGTLE